MSLNKEDIILPHAAVGPRYRTVAVMFGSSTRELFTKTGEQDDTVVVDELCPIYVEKALRFIVRQAVNNRVFHPLTLSSYV